jgi:hypothetical protein
MPVNPPDLKNDRKKAKDCKLSAGGRCCVLEHFSDLALKDALRLKFENK